MQDFRLGFVAEPLPGDEEYAGRLAIPYLTPSGVRGIKYRCVQAHDCKQAKHAKYLQTAGMEPTLYNVKAYHSGLDIIGMAEGEIDALSASAHVGLPTLGVPGVDAWQKYGRVWRLALADFSTVIIFVDGDPPRCHCNPKHKDECPNPVRAGLKLARAIQSDAGGNARLVQCPEGEDVNSMVVAGRVGELREKAGLL